jgi:formamidopyrimidine-DNA glycosylase
MPEGPEVRLITNTLRQKLVGKYIHEMNILGGRYLKHSPPKNYNKFINLLPLKVSSINSYGKFIWWEFEDTELTLWNTLGMSGWWQTKEENHNNVSFSFSGKKTKSKFKKIYFNDQRNFGTFIFDSKDKLKQKISKFGPDIMSTSKADQDKFIKLVKKKKTPICEILLDQKIASGCGNYLRADSLYLAELNPFILGNEIPEEKIRELWIILNHLAWYYYNEEEGIKLKIITKKYPMPNTYDRVFLIYSQKIDPQGNKVEATKYKERTIHWVPAIQVE